MKSLLSALLVLCFCTAYAQLTLKNINLQPTLTLQLKLQSEKGKNGSAVAWDPNKKKYHTAMAGNAEFEIETFNENGNFISKTTAKVDLRGLWYNETYNMIEGNVYEFQDIVSYTINENGGISNNNPEDEIIELPIYNPHAVIQLHKATDEYIWLDYETYEVIKISASLGEETGSVFLAIPNEIDINQHAIICTQIPGAEYGALNYEDNLVYLFDAETGNLAATITLPKEAPSSDVFKFSFANNHIWLYDVENRTWLGYKL